MESPKLELHPEAAKAFNAVAAKLVESLQTPEPRPTPDGSAFVPQVFAAAHVTTKDIVGDFRTGQVLSVLPEIEVSRDYVRNNEQLGLGREGYFRLLKIVEKIQTAPGFRSAVSTKCLLDLAFDWLLKRRQQRIETSFADHLISEASSQITERTIWLPVQRLYIESDIALGRVVFRTITPQMLDRYSSQYGSQSIGSEEGKQAWAADVLKLRKKFQGTAAATVKTLAEPIRANEIALDEARIAVGLLRFFQAASVIPNVKSYCALQTDPNLVMLEYLIEQGSNINHSAKTMFEGPSGCSLSNQDIGFLKVSALDRLNLILSKPARTDFESVLLDSMLLYSRANLTADPSDKLVYIFAALETMFLKDGSEPIQSNLGDRLAWVVGPTVEERIKVAKLVKEVYAMRSRFVHHGRAPRDLETMAQFMQYSWNALCALLKKTESVQTKSALIDDLDRRKMGG